MARPCGPGFGWFPSLLWLTLSTPLAASGPGPGEVPVPTYMPEAVVGKALETLQGSTSLRERQQAVRTLGALGHPDLVPDLVGLQSHPDPTIRFEVIGILAGLGYADSFGFAAIARGLASRSRPVRLLATRALSRRAPCHLRGDRGLSDRALVDPYALVRAEAAAGLATGLPLGARRIRRLVQALEDPALIVRREAALALARQGSRALSARPGLRELIDSGVMFHPEAVHTALRILDTRENRAESQERKRAVPSSDSRIQNP